MDQRVKNLWVNALRSGDFEQGQGNLRKDGKFCCLGVLCELAVNEGIIPPGQQNTAPGFGDGYVYGGDMNYLNPGVIQWAGLDYKNPTVEVPDSEIATGVEGKVGLAVVNDAGKDFNFIANLIEEQL